MANLFGSPQMAAGYANSRPPVHPLIIERIRKHLRITEPVGRALDVGCGAGLSTKALHRIARHCVGIEPEAAMLPWAQRVSRFSAFLVGRAEELPVISESVDVITAAGSLNYADLDRFFPEASRVLRPGGVLVVYDFSPGRSFPDSAALDDWFGLFMERYPTPAFSGRAMSPDSLSHNETGPRLTSDELFEVGLAMSHASYVRYMLTETNVANAVENGTSLDEIEEWCAGTLEAVFDGCDREVIFRGYIAYMS